MDPAGATDGAGFALAPEDRPQGLVRRFFVSWRHLFGLYLGGLVAVAAVTPESTDGAGRRLTLWLARLAAPFARRMIRCVILIAVTVAVSLQTVGVALLVAMLVTPAATAYLLTHRLSTMMILAAVFASLSGVIGLYLSLYLSIASGAAIVLTATAFFLLAFVWKKTRRN